MRKRIYQNRSKNPRAGKKSGVQPDPKKVKTEPDAPKPDPKKLDAAKPDEPKPDPKKIEPTKSESTQPPPPPPPTLTLVRLLGVSDGVCEISFWS